MPDCRQRYLLQKKRSKNRFRGHLFLLVPARWKFLKQDGNFNKSFAAICVSCGAKKRQKFSSLIFITHVRAQKDFWAIVSMMFLGRIELFTFNANNKNKHWWTTSVSIAHKKNGTSYLFFPPAQAMFRFIIPLFFSSCLFAASSWYYEFTKDH